MGSQRHTAEVMWTVRRGIEVIDRGRLDRARLPLNHYWRDNPPSQRLAVEVARVHDEQQRAEDQGRWGDAGSLGAAVIAMTEAYTHLAAVDGSPYVMDGEAFNGAEL